MFSENARVFSKMLRRKFLPSTHGGPASRVPKYKYKSPRQLQLNRPLYI